MEFLPGLLALLLIALVVFVAFRKKASKGSADSQTRPESNTSLDRGQRRLNVAMKRYLVEEMRSEEEWRAFDYLQGIQDASKLGRSDLEEKLAIEFNITAHEAGKRLNRIMRATREVRKRARSATE